MTPIQTATHAVAYVQPHTLRSFPKQASLFPFVVTVQTGPRRYEDETIEAISESEALAQARNGIAQAVRRKNVNPLYVVEDNEPVTLHELLLVNFAADVHAPSLEDVSAIVDLKPGELHFVGFSAVKRII